MSVYFHALRNLPNAQYFFGEPLVPFLFISATLAHFSRAIPDLHKCRLLFMKDDRSSELNFIVREANSTLDPTLSRRPRWIDRQI
jgi:hypothetical protein